MIGIVLDLKIFIRLLERKVLVPCVFRYRFLSLIVFRILVVRRSSVDRRIAVYILIRLTI
jgi:hypothetical protein